MNQKQTIEQKSDQIKFPAIWFENGFAIVLQGSTKRANRLGLKKGSHKNAVIVDANGTKFRLLEMQKKRFLFGWRFGQILELVTGNPEFEVEMTFSAVSSMSVDEMKDLLFKAFRKQQDYWEEMIDFDEFKAKIAASGSFEKLFAVLREFNFMS
jgi:hypothetical protein